MGSGLGLELVECSFADTIDTLEYYREFFISEGKVPEDHCFAASFDQNFETTNRLLHPEVFKL